MTKPKNRSLLSSINANSLADSHDKTSSLAKALNQEKHKNKKESIIPEDITNGDALPVRVYIKIHKTIKVHAAKTNSDIQTKFNEIAYRYLKENGIELED